MKDHSNSFDEHNKYILKYYAKGNKIEAKLATGEKYVVPKTDGNISRIDSIMEKQATSATKEKSSLYLKLFSLASVIAFPFAGLAFYNNGGALFGLLFLITDASAVMSLGTLISRAIKNRDVDKIKYFLKHRTEINENAYKTENIKLGVRKRAIKQISTQARKKEPAINLCNIDDYSLTDLMAMRRNIERYYEYNLEETPMIEETSLEEGPVLGRRYHG